MGKKFIISESEISEIRKMYGLVNEQSSSFSIPQSAIKAISDIESVFSYMSGGKIVGKKYSGDEMAGVMKEYVRDTIGFDCWNNMTDLMKSQIYSFCFQADTSSPYKMKFIAGLANAIDPSISRGDIVGKPLKDPNVQNAINVIKNNCSFIDNYYYDYMRVMDNQYSSMDYNDNYKNIWKYRPTAITRLMNGESWDKVKDDWKLSLTGKVRASQSKSTDNTKPIGKGIITPVEPKEPVISAPSKKKEKITGKHLQEFFDNIRRETVGLKIDFDSVNIDMDKRELTFSLDETQEPVKRLTFGVNLPDEKTCESCVRIGEKNNVPDDKRIKGKFENGTRIFELFALY